MQNIHERQGRDGKGKRENTDKGSITANLFELLVPHYQLLLFASKRIVHVLPLTLQCHRGRRHRLLGSGCFSHLSSLHHPAPKTHDAMTTNEKYGSFEHHIRSTHVFEPLGPQSCFVLIRCSHALVNISTCAFQLLGVGLLRTLSCLQLLLDKEETEETGQTG